VKRGIIAVKVPYPTEGGSEKRKEAEKSREKKRRRDVPHKKRKREDTTEKSLHEKGIIQELLVGGCWKDEDNNWMKKKISFKTESLGVI